MDGMRVSTDTSHHKRSTGFPSHPQIPEIMVTHGKPLAYWRFSTNPEDARFSYANWIAESYLCRKVSTMPAQQSYFNGTFRASTPKCGHSCGGKDRTTGRARHFDLEKTLGNLLKDYTVRPLRPPGLSAMRILRTNCCFVCLADTE